MQTKLFSLAQRPRSPEAIQHTDGPLAALRGRKLISIARGAEGLIEWANHGAYGDPRGSKRSIFKESGPKHHCGYGFWDQSP